MSKNQKHPFWKMTKNAAKNSGELIIYGYISEFDWWGEDVTPKQFAADLSALGDIDELAIRINSGGGDVFAGVAIHSMLKRHAANKTVYVDGWAASIASIIAMAGDRIVMPLGSQLMIHNPWTSVWGGEAKDLRETADFLDNIRDSLVDIYQARTGLDREEIISLMDDETWMSASEAVEKGFADEVENAISVAASMRNGMAFINGVGFDFSRFTKAPELPEASIPLMPPKTKENGNLANQGVKKDMNLDDLKNQHPDLYEAAVQDGINKERARMKAIDEIGIPGNDDVINKAKYETGLSAEATAMEILKAQKAKGNQYLNALRNDSADSGVDDVDPAVPDKQTDGEKVEEAAAKIAEFANKKRGGGR